MEIRETDTPPWELLSSDDESPESLALADYVERDYFPKYYPAPVVEAGEERRDLVRLRMEI